MMEMIPDAMAGPAIFVSKFLKRQELQKGQMIESIYKMFCDENTRRQSDAGKRDKYKRRMETVQSNYGELSQEQWQTEFNKVDFLKTAYLQYLLCAYHIEMQQ